LELSSLFLVSGVGLNKNIKQINKVEKDE
jgi:hypothetical protein